MEEGSESDREETTQNKLSYFKDTQVLTSQLIKY
jgi:hypothetical protein